jgi:hypothetical protein
VSWLASRRRAGLVALALVAVGLVAVAAWRARRGAVTGAAEWIWAPLDRGSTEPVAFWAVRDFELASVPAAAELAVLADEEYVAWLNGRRVGSNRYAPGAPLDRYAVAELLLPGPNRLAVELRSARGAGGLLATLRPAAGEPPAVVSDASWRILRRHRAGLLPGWAPVADSEAPLSWGRPPTGRWNRPRPGPLRPLAIAPDQPCDPRPPATAWRRDDARIFDWGEEVFGYLAVHRDLERAADAEVALFLTGDRPRRPLAEPEAALPLVPLPGRAEWTDSVPRRFRYATVTGLASLDRVEVIPVDPAAEGGLPRPAEAAPGGVFGVQPPPSLTPAEKRVRRRLDRGTEDGGGG